MANSWRISALAERHRALGSQPRRLERHGHGLDLRSDLADHHQAIRTRAGLMDVSGLKKVHYVGPHAESLLRWATTRDIAKLYPGKSVYASMLDEDGKFVDDCVVYRTGPNAFMVVHGAGSGHEMLVRSAQGRQVAVLFDDDLHDLSLQGPLAVDFLAEHVPGIRQLPYFHHLQTRLFDRPVMISRTGYTGERGYEIFCKAADAPALWDTHPRTGREPGHHPLRLHRAGLVAGGKLADVLPLRQLADVPLRRPEGRRHAVGNGPGFHRLAGQDANSAAPRSTFACAARSASGSSACCSKAYAPAEAGDTLWRGDRQVGVITCGMYSRLSKRSHGHRPHGARQRHCRHRPGGARQPGERRP